MDIGAAVLCGGKSSRMGSDKAQLKLFGKSFLELIMRELSAFDEVLISSGERCGGIRDVYPDCGPLGGIYSVLLAAKSGALLVLSCDMPLFCRDLAARLLSLMQGGYDAVICSAFGRDHPLCAIYSKSCLPTLLQKLQSGDFCVMSALSKLNILHYDASAFDFMLTNVNTPADMAALTNDSGKFQALSSRRNRVLRRGDKLIKIFNEKKELETELSVLSKLSYPGCSRLSEHVLQRDYIQGETALELFSLRESISGFLDADRELCIKLFYCLRNFYSAFPCFRLNDLSLKNIICSQSDGAFRCIDFELCSKGSFESDIGLLLAHILTYAPQYTAYKRAMADCLLGLFSALPGTSAESITAERDAALKMLAKRREWRAEI